MQCLRILQVMLAFLGVVSCSSYQYARNVRMVAFSLEPAKATSVGSIEGRDCTWSIFDNPIGSPPTLERAVTSVRTQKGYHSFNRGTASKSNKPMTIRALTHVRTDSDDADYWIVKKTCMVVKGEGFQ